MYWYCCNDIWLLLLALLFTPRRRNGETLVASVEKPEHVSSKDVAHVLHTADARAVGLHWPMGHMEWCVYHRHLVFLGSVLKSEIISSEDLNLHWSYQITLSGNGNENQVITHAHFLTLGSLLGCWMHRPPACLAFWAKIKSKHDRDLFVFQSEMWN